MEKYVIKGGSPLVGEVEIGGAKNAALAILAAACLTDDVVVIDNSLMQEKLETLHAAKDSLKIK